MHLLRRAGGVQVTEVQSATYISPDAEKRPEIRKLLPGGQKKFPVKGYAFVGTANGHSGIFPCFFGGFFSRFVPSIPSARISFFRVSRGWMTASTKPRSAAM